VQRTTLPHEKISEKIALFVEFVDIEENLYCENVYILVHISKFINNKNTNCILKLAKLSQIAYVTVLQSNKQNKQSRFKIS